MGSQKKTILLVEDNEQLNRLWCRILNNAGYDVIGAADGEEALDLIQSCTVDLLICDVMLPGAAGTTVANAHRDLRQDAKILLISGLVPQDGFCEYPILIKPFDRQELERAVARLLH